MKTLEEIRNECRNENHAARRLLSAGFRLEGWDMNTGRRIVARITNEFLSTPSARRATWIDRRNHRV